MARKSCHKYHSYGHKLFRIPMGRFRTCQEPALSNRAWRNGQPIANGIQCVQSESQAKAGLLIILYILLSQGLAASQSPYRLTMEGIQ
jgi:hypothetical protein